MKSEYPNWYYVTHEGLSENPHIEFKRMFKYLNLNFGNKVKEYIVETTNTDNPSDRESKNVHTLKRNSKENIYSWRTRLTKDEIKKIKIGTKEICKKLYQTH